MMGRWDRVGDVDREEEGDWEGDAGADPVGSTSGVGDGVGVPSALPSHGPGVRAAGGDSVTVGEADSGWVWDGEAVSDLLVDTDGGGVSEGLGPGLGEGEGAWHSRP